MKILFQRFSNLFKKLINSFKLNYVNFSIPRKRQSILCYLDTSLIDQSFENTAGASYLKG